MYKPPKKYTLPWEKRPLNQKRESTIPSSGMQKIANESERVRAAQALQLQANSYNEKKNRADSPGSSEGLPAQLKSGIETLSGESMEDVTVTYNSSRPAQLQAHAFAQGNSIHIAPGQEKHLAHEAWHVVQQKQSRVPITRQLKGEIGINDNAGLEAEADRMGAKALRHGGTARPAAPVERRIAGSETGIVQRAQDARKSITQPDAGDSADSRSAKVPDLPMGLVAQIEAANTKAKRQSALEELVKYLNGKDAIIDTNLDGTTLPLNVVYAHSAGGGNLATTVVDTGGADSIADDAVIKITVFKGAFEKGPAILYSSLRHEFIHAAQRMNSADDESSGSDPSDDYIYEELYEKINNDDDENGNRTAAIKKKLQIPLQEIETHSWEILHSQETGISQEYFLETYEYLKAYTNEMLAYVAELGEKTEDQTDEGGAKIARRLLGYWKGYIAKALAELIPAYQGVKASGSLSQDESGDMDEVIEMFQAIIASFTE